MLHQINNKELCAVQVGLCLLADAIDANTLNGMQKRLLTNSGMHRTPTSKDVESLGVHLEIHKIPECISQLMASVEALLKTCELNLDDLEPETETAIRDAANLLLDIQSKVY